MHGKPGTGKSHTISTIVDFFEKQMGWTRGVEFQVCSLQQVLAAQIGGETVHHMAGINPFAPRTVVSGRYLCDLDRP